jgi:hypothetical protein
MSYRTQMRVVRQADERWLAKAVARLVLQGVFYAPKRGPEETSAPPRFRRRLKAWM